MPLLLHISDTHFGTCDSELVEALRALCASQRPDALVVSGDLTQRARPSQFAEARAFVDSLDVPLFLSVPGNHDIPLHDLPARILNPYGGYRRFFGDDLEPEIDTPELLILGVNTTRRYRHKHGEVSRAQIERVARRLASSAPGQMRIVVTHQPAMVPLPQDRANRLRGGAQAAQAWADAGADLLLGGHAHLPYVLEVPSGPSSARAGSLHCLQAGTALSRRVRHGEPNSVNFARWESSAPAARPPCQAERWDYDRASGSFKLARSTPLAPRG